MAALLIGLVVGLRLALVGAVSVQAESHVPSAEERAKVRAQWETMTPLERAELERNWLRWSALTAEDRAVMTRRHLRLERARRRERESLGGELPKEWQPLDEKARRHELSRRALSGLRAKFESLPPEVRDSIQAGSRSQPPRERERRAKQTLEPYVEFALGEQVRAMAERGELPKEAAIEFARKLQRAPAERLALVKQFIGEHPDAFHVPPEIAERVRGAADPATGLRLLDQVRRRRGDRPPFPPRLPRFPRDGAPDGRPDGRPEGIREGPPRPEGQRQEGPRPEGERKPSGRSPSQ
ncbi:MAG: hypothetical protein EXS13_06315 [Planctomycetes bacterium]|nr:hypothetical protein [Planctomycetota bacterium]